MFEEKKKLIIVCSPKTKVYAYQLLQLIGKKDDTENRVVGCKDGSVEATVWEEKNYLANECQLSSDTKVVFIGDIKVVKSIIPNIEEKYKRYGMKYGWMGNRAVIYLDKQNLTEDQYFRFYKYARAKGKIFEKIREEAEFVEKSTFKDKLLSVSEKVQTTITSPAMNKKIREQQYSMATHHFYLEGLSHFLEE